MKFAPLTLLPLLAVFGFAPVSHADTLKGTSVTGILSVDGSQNDFSPAMRTVGPGLEFNATEVGSSGITCEYTANLSAKKIVIRDACSSAVSELAALAPDARGDAKPPFTMTFTDAALSGDTVTAINNALGLTFSLTGDTLTFSFDDADPAGKRSSFAVTSAVTPEPASWQLLALGLTGMGLLAGTTKLRTVG